GWSDARSLSRARRLVPNDEGVRRWVGELLLKPTLLGGRPRIGGDEEKLCLAHRRVLVDSVIRGRQAPRRELADERLNVGCLVSVGTIRSRQSIALMVSHGEIDRAGKIALSMLEQADLRVDIGRVVGEHIVAGSDNELRVQSLGEAEDVSDDS